MAQQNPGRYGLVSWWRLNEASGDAVDSHGTNNLTISAGDTIPPSGHGRDFEVGDADYFTIASNATLNFGDADFSIGSWVKPESVTATYQNIIGKFNQTANKRQYSLLEAPNTYKFRFYVSGNGTAENYVEWATAPSAGNLYFVLGWHDSVNNLIGISVNGGNSVTAAHTTGTYSGNAPFNIGSNSVPANYYDGIIGQAFLYSKVLSADNIEWLYNGGVPRDYSELGMGYNLRSPIFGGVVR